MGRPQLDLIRTGFSLIDARERILLFKIGEFELVLHRPIEITRLSINLSRKLPGINKLVLTSFWH
jgi:hypothetical protein